MITLSNGLSVIRAPLALLFLQENPSIRFAAVFLAMITDCIDGYVARRSKSASHFGAILDPSMDKLFVITVLTILLLEHKVSAFEMTAMLSRDFFLVLFGGFLVATNRWKTWTVRAIRWGKITTGLQFSVLMALCLDITVPWYVFGSFIVMGWLAFLELFQISERIA